MKDAESSLSVFNLSKEPSGRKHRKGCRLFPWEKRDGRTPLFFCVFLFVWFVGWLFFGEWEMFINHYKSKSHHPDFLQITL